MENVGGPPEGQADAGLENNFPARPCPRAYEPVTTFPVRVEASVVQVVVE